MNEFKFTCPHCGQQLEADESFCGQEISCPSCSNHIAVPRDNPQLAGRRQGKSGWKSMAGARNNSQMADQRQGATAMRIDVVCPHCGTEYEAEESEYGRFVKCAICGKGFVAGASGNKANMRAENEQARTVQNMRKEKSWDVLAHAPWTVQFATVYATVFVISLAMGDFVCDVLTCDVLTSESPSYQNVLVGIAIALIIRFSLARANFVRWLFIVWGAFNVIMLPYVQRVSPDVFSWFWCFDASFIFIAVLLLLKPSTEWYCTKPRIYKDIDICRNIGVAVIAAFIAIAAAIFFFNGYIAMRGESKIRREAFLNDYTAMSGELKIRREAEEECRKGTAREDYSSPSSTRPSSYSPTGARSSSYSNLSDVEIENRRKVSLYHSATNKLDRGVMLNSEEIDVLRKVVALEELNDMALRKASKGYDLSARELKAMGAWMSWKAAEDPDSTEACLHKSFEASTGISSKKDHPLLSDDLWR